MTGHRSQFMALAGLPCSKGIALEPRKRRFLLFKVVTAVVFLLLVIGERVCHIVRHMFVTIVAVHGIIDGSAMANANW